MKDLTLADHLETFTKSGREKGTPAYKAASDAIEAICPEFNQGGYWNDTNQRCISFKVYADGSNIKSVFDGLTLLVPFVKDCSNGKNFHISESTLGDHGVYSLVLDGEAWKIIKHYYGSPRDIASFSDLMEALVYIKDNLPGNDYRRDGEDQ